MIKTLIISATLLVSSWATLADSAEQKSFRPPYTVEIYTALFCGFCEQVKERLEGLDIDYIEYGTVFSTSNHKEMLKRTYGEDGVPRIFLNNQYIGGFRQFQAISQHQLDLLAAGQPIQVMIREP